MNILSFLGSGGRGDPRQVSATDPLPVTSTGTAVLPTGAATAAKQPALGVAGTPSADVITVQGSGYKGTATATRGANQTPYTAGDVVGGALAIINAGPSAGDVLITNVRIMLNITALPAGMTNFTLHVYNATPPSAIADNAPFTLGSGDRAAYLGHIDNIPAVAVGVGTQSVQAQLSGLLELYRLAAASTSLFAYLVTNAAYTPAANSETYDLTTRGLLP